MGSTALRHFDYLVGHAHDLEDALGLTNLARDVERWRRFGMEDPAGALVGCRRTMEVALRTLASPLPNDRMPLTHVISFARRTGKVSRAMARTCDEIRRLGNRGAHAATIETIEAQRALGLLDDFLRACAEDLHLIGPRSRRDAPPCDPIFLIRTDDELDDLARRARVASALDEDGEVERRVQQARVDIEAADETGMSDLQKMEELIRQAEAIGASAAAHGDEQTLAAQKVLYESIAKRIEAMGAERHEVAERFDEVSAKVDEILNEHDFIRKLLMKDGAATVEQHEVMAFPKGSRAVTNILQIAGGAGTGKTLCLLAKLISEVDDLGQQSLIDEPSRRALFVCFNRGLATYVRDILANYEGPLPAIDVESYDEFINQLVRERPKRGFEHLGVFATDVKYAGKRIVYGADDEYVRLLKTAQATVAERHPDHAGDYYLDPADADGLAWLKDELAWLEARFDSTEDALARYPKAERIGRGTKRRPREAMRLIILEVWCELDRLLATRGLYTIEQATRRLMGSQSLPAYDAIAIDEVQDFSLSSIRLLLRFRRGDGSRVFLSGDENQKIYHRDFTWKELDEGLKGHTITLHQNMRNSGAIKSFSDRLLGLDCPLDAASDKVHVVDADDERVLGLLRRLADPSLHQTSALITGQPRSWEAILRSAGVPLAGATPAHARGQGLHVLGALTGKGLEFDNVVVDYTSEAAEDEEEERRLRYVHFTRARRRLYVRYHGTPPKLLTDYYADFVE